MGQTKCQASRNIDMRPEKQLIVFSGQLPARHVTRTVTEMLLFEKKLIVLPALSDNPQRLGKVN